MLELPDSTIPSLRTIELTTDFEPKLQAFFDANPVYFFAVQGERARPDEAKEEITGPRPQGWMYTKKWVIGYVDASDEVVAMANVVSDLLAPGVWHIGLFILATSRHGTGDARKLYSGLETWAASNGADWLRLGVVKGNVRAERFWHSNGYIQTRTRDGVEMGRRTNTLCVMFKPLKGGSIEQYLSLVPRDRPVCAAEVGDV
jgi:GNAT superfamily N-acetyltransferase